MTVHPWITKEDPEVHDALDNARHVHTGWYGGKLRGGVDWSWEPDDLPDEEFTPSKDRKSVVYSNDNRITLTGKGERPSDKDLYRLAKTARAALQKASEKRARRKYKQITSVTVGPVESPPYDGDDYDGEWSVVVGVNHEIVTKLEQPLEEGYNGLVLISEHLEQLAEILSEAGLRHAGIRRR